MFENSINHSLNIFSMEKVQVNKSRMYGSVDKVLDDNSKIVALFDDLLAAHQKLKESRLIIDQNRQVQVDNTSGMTITKSVLRTKLTDRVLQFSAVVEAYATSKKDDTLRIRAHYVRSDLNKKPDSILYDIGFYLMQHADPIRADIAKYSVGDNEFIEMQRLLDELRLTIPQRRVATGYAKVSTINIGDEFSTVDKLLKETMDSLMRPFHFTHPDFFNAYMSARKIVNYTGGGKKKTVPPKKGKENEETTDIPEKE